MRREETGTPCEAAADLRGSLIGLIDYMLLEAGEIEPLAAYFLRMARATLVESIRSGADRRGES
jgi:hypothetical protein